MIGTFSSSKNLSFIKAFGAEAAFTLVTGVDDQRHRCASGPYSKQG